MLGRKTWQLGKPHRRAGVERVADRELTRVDEADDVACVGDTDRLAVAAEEPIGARRLERLPQPAVGYRHVLREASGADADKRDPVSMARIHVRLNLEDKTGEAFIRGGDDPGIAQMRLRRQRQIDQRLKKRL